MLTARQLTIWIFMYEIGSSLLIIPAAVAAVAKQDAPWSVVAAIALHLALLPLYNAVRKQMRGMGVVQYARSLFGKVWGSAMVLVFLLLFPCLIFIMTLRNLGDFVTTLILVETPITVVHVVAIAVVAYAYLSGLKVIGRSAELMFPIVLCCTIILTMSLLPSLNVHRLLPVMESGIMPVLGGAFPLLAFPFLEGFFFLFLSPSLKEQDAWSKVMYKSSMASGTLFFIVVFMVIAVLGPHMTANLTFPSYFVIRTVSIADFYERFEVLLAVAWMITIFFRLCLLMYISVHGLSEALSIDNSKSLVIPLCLIALGLVDAVWPNISYLIQFIGVWPIYITIAGVMLPAGLWLIGKWKHRQPQDLESS
jgi:spore germination protein KB